MRKKDPNIFHLQKNIKKIYAIDLHRHHTIYDISAKLVNIYLNPKIANLKWPGCKTCVLIKEEWFTICWKKIFGLSKYL